MPRVKLLAIVPEKILQLKTFAIEQSPLYSLLKPPKPIDIRSPALVRLT